MLHSELRAVPQLTDVIHCSIAGGVYIPDIHVTGRLVGD